VHKSFEHFNMEHACMHQVPVECDSKQNGTNGFGLLQKLYEHLEIHENQIRNHKERKKSFNMSFTSLEHIRTHEADSE